MRKVNQGEQGNIYTAEVLIVIILMISRASGSMKFLFFYFFG